MNEAGTLKLHWSSGKPNFGDWLSPALVTLLSGRPVEHADPGGCDLIAVGSILHRLKHRWFNRRVHVWGTGFIEERRPISSRHYYHAVRGWHTARQLRGVEISCVGDPGLLADRLLPDRKMIPKTHRLGLVPHYKDHADPRIAALAAQIPGTAVLDVLVEPVEFLRRAAGCEFILSSSLHGLIVADSMGIPNAWMSLSDSVRGAGFKFADYYSVFGIPDPKPVDLRGGLSESLLGEWARASQRPGMEEIKSKLVASFPFPKN
jgi:pyruvyltransferase